MTSKAKDVLWERLQVSKVLSVEFMNKSAAESEVALTIYEATQILGKIVLSDKFMVEIQNLIQRKQFFIEENLLKAVKLPSIKKVVDGNFLFLMAKSEKHNLNFGILFDYRQEEGFYIVGIWPHDFVEQCKKDKEIFQFLLFRLVNTPDYFANVTLYRPVEGQAPSMIVKQPTQAVAPPAQIPQAPPLGIPPAAAPPLAPPAAPAAAPEPAQAGALDIASVIKSKKCPYCNAQLPEPRLQVLERGRNTFCANCYNIIKGQVSETPAAPAVPQAAPRAAAPIAPPTAPPMAPPLSSDVRQLNLPRFLDPFLNCLQNPQFMLESALLYIVYSLDQMNIEMRKIYNKNMTEIENRKNEILSAKDRIMSSNDTTQMAYPFKMPAYISTLYPVLESNFQDLMIYGLMMMMEWLGVLSQPISLMMQNYERIFSQIQQKFQ